MQLEQLVAERRLLFWNRLLADDVPCVDELDRELLTETRDGCTEERTAFVLLRACVLLGIKGSPATKRVMRTALFHWFSHVGSQEIADQEMSGGDATDALALMGRRLSWKEAAQLTGSNPDDYSAYHRFLKKLREECLVQWREVFGKATAPPF